LEGVIDAVKQSLAGEFHAGVLREGLRSCPTVVVGAVRASAVPFTKNGFGAGLSSETAVRPLV